MWLLGHPSGVRSTIWSLWCIRSCVLLHVTRPLGTSKRAEIRESCWDADASRTNCRRSTCRSSRYVSTLQSYLPFRRRKASVGRFNRTSLSWYSRFLKPSIILVARRCTFSMLLMRFLRCGDQTRRFCSLQYVRKKVPLQIDGVSHILIYARIKFMSSLIQSVYNSFTNGYFTHRCFF